MSKNKKMAFDFMIFDDLMDFEHFVNYVNNKIIKKKFTG